MACLYMLDTVAFRKGRMVYCYQNNASLYLFKPMCCAYRKRNKYPYISM